MFRITEIALAIVVGAGMALATSAPTAPKAATDIATVTGIAAATDIAVASSVAPAPVLLVSNRAPAEAKSERYSVTADGNEARYRVREELAGMDFPSDAIGATNAITGSMVIDGKGKVMRDSSHFAINLTTLKSDKTRRDNYIKESTLESDTYPTALFVPFEMRGLPSKLPTSGTMNFQMIGNLSIHGVTRLTTWAVTAQASDGAYSGRATTSFTFDDFKMDQPNVPVLLSVNDTIKLEYDFKVARVIR